MRDCRWLSGTIFCLGRSLVIIKFRFIYLLLIGMIRCGCDDVDVFKNCRSAAQAKKISKYIFYYGDIIRKGKFSSVYRGIDTTTEKPVAVKMIDMNKYNQSNLLNLLYQQAQILPKINHPNIVHLYTRLISENHCYLVMELCKKKNLEQRIFKKEIDHHERERIILDIFKGLNYLNQKSILHRDIKTANILFSENGKAVISDFGFAVQSYSEIQDIFVGTPFYMSPEAMLYQKYSSKSDIWSFGIIVYELYHGYVPLASCRTSQQIKEMITKPVKISEKISPDVQDFLEGCLDLNSYNRWSIQKIRQCSFMNKLNKRFTISTNVFQLPPEIRQQRTSLATTLPNSSQFMNDQSMTIVSQHSAKQSQVSNNYSTISKLERNYEQFGHIIVSYRQALSLVHYCRLINRILEEIGVVDEILGLWLLRMIGFLNDKLAYMSDRDQYLISVIRGYKEKYTMKYGYLGAAKKVELITVLKGCNNLMRNNSKIKAQNKTQSLKLLNCLLKETQVLGQCLQKNKLKQFTAFSNCERTLKSI